MIDKTSHLSGGVLIVDIEETRHFAGLRERLIERQDLGRRFNVRMPAGVNKAGARIADILRRYLPPLRGAVGLLLPQDRFGVL